MTVTSSQHWRASRIAVGVALIAMLLFAGEAVAVPSVIANDDGGAGFSTEPETPFVTTSVLANDVAEVDGPTTLVETYYTDGNLIRQEIASHPTNLASVIPPNLGPEAEGTANVIATDRATSGTADVSVNGTISYLNSRVDGGFEGTLTWDDIIVSGPGTETTFSARALVDAAVSIVEQDYANGGGSVSASVFVQATPPGGGLMSQTARLGSIGNAIVETTSFRRLLQTNPITIDTRFPVKVEVNLIVRAYAGTSVGPGRISAATTIANASADLGIEPDEEVFVVGEGYTVTSASAGVINNRYTDGTEPILTVESFDTTGTLGAVTTNGNGTFTYDPNGAFDALTPGETATDTFTYVARDRFGNTDTATVTIEITNPPPPPPPPEPGDGSTAIFGRAVYEDSDGAAQGIEGATVQVCVRGLLGTRDCQPSTTSFDGSFSAVLPDPPPGELVRVDVEVIAQSPRVQVGPPGLLPIWYCFRRGPYAIADGEARDIGEISALNGSRSCDVLDEQLTDPRENAGFYVFTQLERAQRFMAGLNSQLGLESPDLVTARLEAENDGPSFYVSLFKTMTLMPYAWDGSPRALSTILHEYGHHVLYESAESPAPTYDNGICDDSDTFLIFEIPDPGHCQWFPELGVVAWTEGFPTFLAAVIEKELYGTTSIGEGPSSFSQGGVDYFHQGIEFPPMVLVDTQEDVLWYLQNGRGLREGHPYEGELEMIEGWTSAVLWDVYDSDTPRFLGDFGDVDDHDQNLARDTTQLSFLDIWRVITGYDPDPFDDSHNHPTSLDEFYDGVRAMLPISQARLAGAFLENHRMVPAAEAEFRGGILRWDSEEIFGRGDVFSTTYEACRPYGSEVPWGGEMSVGVYLERSGERFLNLPPLALPDLAEGECESGVYEFTIPEDLQLIGPQLLGGVAEFYNPDRADSTFAHLCLDPYAVLAEHDEENNCKNAYGLKLQNRPPVLVSNAGPDGFVVDEGSELVIDFSGSTDPDPIPGLGLLYKVTGSFDGLGDIGDGFYRADAVQVFTPADTPLLADGSAEGLIGDVRLLVRDGDTYDFSSEAFADVPLVVNNVAPTVVVTNAPPVGPFLVFEGSPLTIEGVFRDPGADEWTAESYVYNVDADWVPGTITSSEYTTTVLPPAYQGHLEVERTFAQDTSDLPKGIADFVVCVEDDDGGRGCTPTGQLAVRVFNVLPTVQLNDAVVDEGTPFQLAGSFTDPGADVWSGTVAINGGPSEPVAIEDDKTFTSPLSFAQDGLQSVEVCIDDGDDVGCAATATIVVKNVAPNVTLDRVPDTFVAHVEDTIAVSFADPGALDSHTATIDWAHSLDSLGGVVSPFSGRHAYAAEGSVTIEVCVTDDADDEGCASTVIEVLTPEGAIREVVDELAADGGDRTVQRALRALEGSSGDPGALDELSDGDVVAAVRKLGRAVDRLDRASGDYSGAQLVLAQSAESIVRDLLARAEALNPTSRRDIRLLERSRERVAAGRAAFEIGDYSEAVDSYQRAARSAGRLLGL